jgi:c-di-GMP-related signal transduction protein
VPSARTHVPQKVRSASDADLAGARLLADTVLDLRLDTITDGRTAFIHLTRSLLLNGAAALLRPDALVFQLRQDVAIDSDALEACRSLKSSVSNSLSMISFLARQPKRCCRLPAAPFPPISRISGSCLHSIKGA